MGQSEPPSQCSRHSPLFFIGRNGRGNWVVRDQSGRCGGLFVDRAEALRFALFENGRRPQAVVMVPGILELDVDHSPNVLPSQPFAGETAVRRVA
jgi:hypothetical protein